MALSTKENDRRETEATKERSGEEKMKRSSRQQLMTAISGHNACEKDDKLLTTFESYLC